MEIEQSIADVLKMVFMALGITIPNNFIKERYEYGKYHQCIINGKTWWYIIDNNYPFVASYGCIELDLIKICSTFEQYDSLTKGQKKSYDEAVETMRKHLELVTAGYIKLDSHGVSVMPKDGQDHNDYDNDDDDNVPRILCNIHKPIILPDFDPDNTLSDIQRTICKYVKISPLMANMVALWIAFTWFVYDFNIAPLLIVKADDEHHDNMSTLFYLLLKLSNRAVRVTSISTIFLKTLHKEKPITLLYDDPAFIRSRELMNIIITSHRNDDSFKYHKIGKNYQVIPTFGAKALASNGALPKSIMSMGIEVDLTQRNDGVRAERLTKDDQESLKSLQNKLEYFSKKYRDRVCEAKPVLLDSLPNNTKDNWEPLFKIAEVAGGNWPANAELASLKLSVNELTERDMRERLLFDVYDIVKEKSKSDPNIRTSTLISELCAIEQAPWVSYNKGEKITSTQLAETMRSFGINVKKIRFKGLKQPTNRGYKVNEIDEAYTRYLKSTAE